MLPTSSSTKGRSGPYTRPNSLPHYLRRIVKWQQMDIEYTFWQMLHLCTSPKVVNVIGFGLQNLLSCLGFILSEKILIPSNIIEFETKNQWARDDPAFVVVCSILLLVSTVAYCATYDHSAGHALFVVISVLLFHFLVTGAILATCFCYLTNNYLREEAPNSHVVEQRVEWLYAFDVHCNSFFPMFLLLYVVHYFLSPLLVAHGFIPMLLSNFLFMTAISYYHYLNFIGYAVLPFLERTTCFLYPIDAAIVLSPILILCGFNPSRYFLNMYFSRRLV